VSPRARRIALSVVGGLLALLIVAQFALPPLAERRLRDELRKYGPVSNAEVHAFPAIQLLWRHADSVKLHLARSAAGQSDVAKELAKTQGVDKIDATVDELKVLSLTLRDAVFRKRGNELTGEATVTDADLRAALPPGVDVRPIATDGNQLVFEGVAGPLAIRARAAAVDGALVVTPDLPFGGLLAITVFADPRVTVEGVTARPGQQAGSFVVQVRGRLK
jgi:hypothetical protein